MASSASCSSPIPPSCGRSTPSSPTSRRISWPALRIRSVPGVRTTAANEPPERPSTSSGRDPKALIRYAIAMTALAAIVLWAAYIVRDALLIVYVSVLLSIGFSPIVRIIERQKVLPVARRLPRWLAILVLYVAILGTVAIVISLVFPPLVEQATALWQKFPDLFERAQAFLMRKGLLNQHVTMREA